MEIHCGPVFFSSNFDSGNLRHVEQVQHNTGEVGEQSDLNPYDYQFNLWTSPDAVGTDYENGNRTWFYFSVRGSLYQKCVKFNVMNMNKQSKLYSQGMSPVYRVVPSKGKWQRIRERPSFEVVEDQFRMSFVHRFAESRFATYFAFCYPYSYGECQQYLNGLEKDYSSKNLQCTSGMYFHRDTLCYTNDRLKVDLLTVSSMKNITSSCEHTIPDLFPDDTRERSLKFQNKKIFFLSSRVHPGETPASFVFNGFLKFILRKDDKRAIALRDQFVFKLVPMLNPDGVKRGHYRTDSLGVNLNRKYLNPDPVLQPSIYAVKTLLAYYSIKTAELKLPLLKQLHCNNNKTTSLPKPNCKLKDFKLESNGVVHNEENSTLTNYLMNSECLGEKNPILLHKCPTDPSLYGQNLNACFDSVKDVFCTSRDDCNEDVTCTDENSNTINKEHLQETFKRSLSLHSISNETEAHSFPIAFNGFNEKISIATTDCNSLSSCGDCPQGNEAPTEANRLYNDNSPGSCELDIYVDLHGHASKRGCFIYGNYYEDDKTLLKCMLFPKLISANTAHFDFQACNFSERNMYHRDRRDGQSKEGSGRVAIAKAFGIIRSYTLECNYNSGRSTNSIAAASCDGGCATPPPLPGFPPRYTIEHYEEVGRAMAIAALDLYQINPWSRLPLSEYKSLNGVQDSLMKYIRNSPRSILGMTAKKQVKGRWISPGSFHKANGVKTETNGRNAKISITNFSTIVSSNSNSKVKPCEQKVESKGLTQDAVAKHEKNMRRSITWHSSGKVINVSKLNACMLQDSKANVAVCKDKATNSISSAVSRKKEVKENSKVKPQQQQQQQQQQQHQQQEQQYQQKHQQHLLQKQQHQQRPQQEEQQQLNHHHQQQQPQQDCCVETADFLINPNRKNISPPIWKKKVAQIPSIVNLSPSTHQCVKSLFDSPSPKVDAKLPRNSFINRDIRPIRLGSKKKL